MTREELIERACKALDEIAEIVIPLEICDSTYHGRTTYFLQHKTTKQECYEAIVKIQDIVSEINTLEEN